MFEKNGIILILVIFICTMLLVLTTSKKNKAKVIKIENNFKRIIAPSFIVIYCVGIINILISNMKDYAIYSILAIILIILLILMPFVLKIKDKYIFSNNKKLSKKTPIFRELPCDGDLYKVYWLVNKYGICKNKENFFKAILLKWLKQERIKLENKKTIFFYKNFDFDNDLEQQLYNYLYIASKDGKLESSEFETWIMDNYYKILIWLDNVLEYEEEKLIKEGKLIKKVRSKYFKSWIYIADNSIYEETTKLKGLKYFFNEFEAMNDKELVEVKLWDEYLLYAQIMGVADKLDKQFKHLLPMVIAEDTSEKVHFIKEITKSKK